MARYIQQLRRGWKWDADPETGNSRNDWAKYEDTKYILAENYSATTTYYADKNGTVAKPQPTNKDEVISGGYYIKNSSYIPPLEGELVLEYDNGIPRLKIGNGSDDFSQLPYMSVDSFISPTPTTITLYGGDAWEPVEGFERRYTQDITEQLAGKVTVNSKVDLQPTPEQLFSFQVKDVTFTTINEDGQVRVCVIGERPANNYEDIQVTITEVIG